MMIDNLTPIQVRQQLKRFNIVVIPERQPNGMYKPFVFTSETEAQQGQIEYRDWLDCVHNTERVFLINALRKEVNANDDKTKKK